MCRNSTKLSSLSETVVVGIIAAKLEFNFPNTSNRPMLSLLIAHVSVSSLLLLLPVANRSSTSIEDHQQELLI